MKRFILKRITALFLAMIMTLSLCPNTALAEELLPETYEASSSYVYEGELDYTNEDAFAAYFQREMDKSLGFETPSFYSTHALEGTLAYTLYSALKTELAKIASGEETSTQVAVVVNKTFTKADLGITGDFLLNGDLSPETANAIEKKFQFQKVYDCLLADCPLELYWHDKTVKTMMPFSLDLTPNELTVTAIGYHFAVAQQYSSSNTVGTYETDKSKTSAVNSTLNAAKAIVDTYANKSDMEKLQGYKNTICSLVSYNTHAADSNNNVKYGDPWQMIYVFDEDLTTNVVCEGYAKAFQYLCDLTDFDGDIECHTVTGTMSGGTGAGRHMWNVVNIDDGRNYLVDVTNCDTGTIGADNELFMAYTANSTNNNQTHTFTIDSQNVVYSYDETMADLFCDGFLALSPTAYSHLSATASLTGSTEPLSPGDTVTLTLRFDGTNIAGIDAVLSFDSDVLQLVSAEELVTGGEMNTDTLKFVLQNETTPINTATDVLSVTFRVKSGTAAGTALNISFKDIVVSNGDRDLDVIAAKWTGTVSATPTITKGDANLDGEVNADDLTALARHVARIETLTDSQALLNAEVTGDTDLTADDLTKLARYVARIDTSL